MQDSIANLIICAGDPDKDSSSHVVVYSGSSLGTHSKSFAALLEDLTGMATKSRRPSDIDLHRCCIRHILNSLIHCMFRFDWLSLPTNPSNFKSGEYLNRLGFSQRRMERIVLLLIEQDIIRQGRKGFIDVRPGETSQASQYFPTESFISQYSSSLYDTFGDFDKYEPLKFVDFDEADLPSKEEIDRQESIIRRYNEYMRDHTWAMKNPSFRSIKDFMRRSGRINNYYQTLANRRIPLRTSTTIDGEIVAEPDFSCNHLRMASFLVGEELPADPYSVIAMATDLSRDVIKTVITKSIGAARLKQKGGLMKASNKPKRGRVAVEAYEFKAVLAAIEGNYPWVNSESLFFNDIGVRLQYLEGEIALKMFQWGIDEDVPLVAVHDAFACKRSDKEKTYNRMLEVWTEVLSSAKAQNYIQGTQHTVKVVQQRKDAMKKAKADRKRARDSK